MLYYLLSTIHSSSYNYRSSTSIIRPIDAVSPEDIQRVAQDIFQNQKLNLALIGPFKDKKSFGKLLKL